MPRVTGGVNGNTNDSDGNVCDANHCRGPKVDWSLKRATVCVAPERQCWISACRTDGRTKDRVSSAVLSSLFSAVGQYAAEPRVARSPSYWRSPSMSDRMGSPTSSSSGCNGAQEVAPATRAVGPGTLALFSPHRRARRTAVQRVMNMRQRFARRLIDQTGPIPRSSLPAPDDLL